MKKHGYKGTRVYRIWVEMRRRCRCADPNRRTYKYYKKKNIKVCGRWRDFIKFLEDMGEPPTIYHSIDRIDGRGHYTPSNCRWATPLEQANNCHDNNIVCLYGKKKSISEWCREFKMKRTTVWNRLNRGWPIEDAFTIRPLPSNMRHSKICR